MRKDFSIVMALSLGLLAVSLFINLIEVARGSESYHAGENYARSLQTQVQGMASQSSLSSIPQFVSDNPPQTQLQDQNMADAAKRELMMQEGAKAITESYNNRGKFKLDLAHDPLITQANEVVKAPLQTVAGQSAREIERPPEAGKPELFACEESGDPAIYTCLENRIIKITLPETQTHKLTVSCYSHGWGGGLGVNVITGQKLDSTTSNTLNYAAGARINSLLAPSLRARVTSVKLLNSGCGASLNKNGNFWVPTSSGWGWVHLNNVTFAVEITYKPLLQESDIEEHLDGTCAGLELKAEQGGCEYVAQTITQGPETRTFNGHEVTREWWQRQLTYQCTTSAAQACGPLKARGCHQVDSICKQKVGQTCVLWQQTYQCQSQTKEAPSKSVTGQGIPFCLDGHCTSQTYEANNEMLDAIAKLSVFKEIQDDIKGGIGQIFKGSDQRCRKNCAGFKDCCRSLKGWGLSMSLTECSAGERQLAREKDKKLCHQVGTYCDKKKLGICITKKTSYCCFPSKLSRMIHEQGRAQLGISWGEADCPQCRGLSVEELSRIDFSRVDMSELYQDVMAKYRAPNLTKLQQSVSERLDQLQASLKGAKTPQALAHHLRKTQKEGL